MKHVFVICAYGNSPYLSSCVRSLLRQTRPSPVLVVTSTPNDHIRGICDRYHLPLYIREGASGLAEDWNFGLITGAGWLNGEGAVTLAHQDDLYLTEYAGRVTDALSAAKNPLIAMTDYAELREGSASRSGLNLTVKRLMLSPLRLKGVSGLRWVKRAVLSLGNPICCPSVTYVIDRLPLPLFEAGMKSNTDWLAWAGLTERDGSFCYVPQTLMGHRIHRDSTTTRVIGEGGRIPEDLAVLRRFWPEKIAVAIEQVYQLAERSNG